MRPRRLDVRPVLRERLLRELLLRVQLLLLEMLLLQGLTARHHRLLVALPRRQATVALL